MININEIIELVRQQEPRRQDIIIALTNTFGGYLESKAYYKFVDSAYTNEKVAEWQFEENFILESETFGTLVIDYLKDNRIGGIEFLKNVE